MRLCGIGVRAPVLRELENLEVTPVEWIVGAAGEQHDKVLAFIL